MSLYMYLLISLFLSYFLSDVLTYSPDHSDKRFQDEVLRDRTLQVCNKCCRPGSYEHGNEKCGLAVDSAAFSFELLRRLSDNRQENIVISPFSVMNILMLLSLGTEGKTRDEIRTALKFPFYFPPEHDHMMMKCALMRYDGVSIRAANAVFYDQGKATSRRTFIQEVARYYNVTVKGVSFFADPFHAWMSISDFIRQTSNGFLDNVLQETAISELVFINTVYFNGTWNFEVPPNSKKQITFYKDYMTKRQVEAFTVTSVFNTATIDKFGFYGDNIRVVELPYTDNQFSMFIFKSENGQLSLAFMEDVIKKLTISGVQFYFMQEELLNLTIPKFSITYQSDIADTLVDMGIRRLFSRERGTAEMNNLFETSDLLSADRLVHTAKIMVTEAGTEAAAASIVGVSRGGYYPTNITFSHPFIFVLYDKCNNLILFQGRCYDPSTG